MESIVDIPLENSGELVSVSKASGSIARSFRQDVIVSAVGIALLLICIIRLKGSFVNRMHMSVRGRWQKIALLVFSVVLIGAALYAVLTKPDKLWSVYRLFYYLVFTAFLRSSSSEMCCPNCCKKKKLSCVI